MHRETIVVTLAAVMGGMAGFMVVVGIAVSPFFLLLSLPFGAATYVMWQHATGRINYRRVRAATSGGRTGSVGGFDRERRAERNRKRAYRTAQSRRRGSRGDGRVVAGGDRLSRREACRTLGVDPGASRRAIRRAYRRRAKETHPDADAGNKEEFKRVTRAYERLKQE